MHFLSMRAAIRPNQRGRSGSICCHIIDMAAIEQTRRRCLTSHPGHPHGVRLGRKRIPKGWNRDLDAKSAAPFIYLFFKLKVIVHTRKHPTQRRLWGGCLPTSALCCLQQCNSYVLILAKKWTQMFLTLLHIECSLCVLVEIILVSYRYITGSLDHKGTERRERNVK